MENKEINEFARKLVEEVRDNAIGSCLSQLNNKSNSPTAKRWQDLLVSGNIEKLQEALIIDSIDDAIFQLLDAIDNKKLNLTYTAENAKQVNLSEEGLGELSGWYAANDWIEEFSKEKYFDDFQDLNL